MKRFSLLIVLAALLVASLAQEKRCQSSGPITFKCPNVCQDRSRESLKSCLALFGTGCFPMPCKGGKFSCSDFQSGINNLFQLPLKIPGLNVKPPPAKVKTVCLGDEVVFSDIDQATIVNYMVDLNAAPTATDFYLLSDATGSMTTAIKDVRDRFQGLIENFDNNPNVGFGVGIYRDETQLTDGFENLQSISTNKELSRSAVKTISADRGGDGPEANLVALYNVATNPSIGWRKKSRKILVYFGDQPGHEPSCVKSPKLTREKVATTLRVRGISVIAVSVGNRNLDGKTTPFKCGGAGAGAGQAKFITEKTRGIFKVAPSATELVKTIRKATADLPRLYNVDESDCVEKITSTFSPKFPIFLTPPGKTTVKHTLKLKDSVCDNPKEFKCKFRFTESNADLPETTIKFLNIKGCEPFTRRKASAKK